MVPSRTSSTPTLPPALAATRLDHFCRGRGRRRCSVSRYGRFFDGSCRGFYAGAAAGAVAAGAGAATLAASFFEARSGLLRYCRRRRRIGRGIGRHSGRRRQRGLRRLRDGR